MESTTAFLENPILLGTLATIITWCVRRLNRVFGQMSVMWVTGAVALALALGNELWAMRTSSYQAQMMAAEFMGFVNTLLPVAQTLISKAVPIFVSTQVIYYSLQSKLAGKVIYGSARVLRRSLDGYEYLAEIVTGGNNGDKTRGT